ncbi:AraC family transcriptional regulator [Streptococcus suis]|nr:AraC family transcriptional regulator [Streptococcus suis]MDY7595017.1 helix-turn-helix domain-containing protein [Streptococcus suis]MDY7595967.1 helix-turn-helix domain-containing protein [Streptococcus suis]MEE3747013.1 helix-turn-helix domain-containing protein [Streptococcus suis]WNF69735.1 helix-turn-helix domain-containing protein [Streptococcus suis]WQE85771.1 helix-turn-helix domain-containing protein [Streptococcus suis]
MLSQISQIQMFVPAFFAALSSPHGIEALDRFARFKKIVGPIEVDMVEAKTTVSITYKFAHANMDLPKFSVLNEQLLVLHLIRTGVGERIVPLVVESPFGYDEETIKEFGLPVQKGKSNLLVFDKADLQKPFLTQNNIMWQYLETELNQHLAQQEREQSFAGYVQQELYSAIPSGFFFVEDIAHRLGVSVRTLQRNLTGENTSFKKELQVVQKAMTLSYLKIKLSIEEISSLVGYSEVNAFSRAFKNWTGMTVTDYRKQQGL